MMSTKRKLQILVAFTVLIMFAFGAGCRGFFVNPTLTTLTVTPSSPQIQQGQSLQMTATGTFDDGSISTGVKNLSWSVTPTSVATINTNSGLLNAITTGTATVTASAATVTGTTGITVVLANVTSIQVSPSSAAINTTNNTTAPFRAAATVSGQTTAVDVTGTATWTLTVNGAAPPTGLFTLSFTNGQEVIQVVGTPPTLPYVVQVTASSPGNTGGTITSNAATLTVN